MDMVLAYGIILVAAVGFVYVSATTDLWKLWAFLGVALAILYLIVWAVDRLTV